MKYPPGTKFTVWIEVEAHLKDGPVPVETGLKCVSEHKSAAGGAELIGGLAVRLTDLWENHRL